MSSAFFIKAICGTLIHKEFHLIEGTVTRVSEELYNDFLIDRWEKEGIVKRFTDYNEALNFQYKGMARLAAESLASLNPPVDNNDNPLPINPPTFNFVAGKPIKPEYNYITDTVKKVAEIVKTDTQKNEDTAAHAPATSKSKKSEDTTEK